MLRFRKKEMKLKRTIQFLLTDFLSSFTARGDEVYIIKQFLL